MNQIIMIVAAVFLGAACVPSSEGQPQPTAPAANPAAATDSAHEQADAAEPVPSRLPMSVSGNARLAPARGLQEVWPSGPAMQTAVDRFLAAGFMKKHAPVGFGDLAYADVELDLAVDGQGRISRINGVLNELYDSYSFEIPVVDRRVDVIPGGRQVNREDVIVPLGNKRWLVHPVALKGSSPVEVSFDGSIELVCDDTMIRLVKSGSDFTCTEHRQNADGQEQLLLSWKIRQYERGPVQELVSTGESSSVVPVVLVWEPGAIAGYLVDLPEGGAVFAQRLRWEPAGDPETDRFNFLVLLTQRHGGGPGLPDTFGSVDPLWLALLMYDHVVSP